MPAEVELREPIERAMGYVERWAAPLAELDAAAAVAGGDHRYIAEDLTHNVGRALDALLKGREVTGRAVDGAVLAALRAVLFTTLDNPIGFPAAWCRLTDFYHDGQQPGMTCAPHNLREAVQALLELYRADGDAEARRRLGTLLDTLLAITDDGGLYRADRIAAEPLLNGVLPFADHRLVGAFYQSCTQNRGRLIMALTQAYRALGDPRALELAQRFVRLVRSEAFAEDGHLTHFAGNHTHSITGTVHGLADWGLLAGDLDTLDHARRIMEVGLPPTCSSFGWSIEGAWREVIPGRGEVNNTGDMVQAALILGRAGWPRFFESAERMIRSHVLPSQWRIGQPYRRPPDDPKNPPPRVPDDEDGGWGCPAVNDRYGRSRFGVLDITQGGIQCLWAAIREGISRGSARHGREPAVVEPGPVAAGGQRPAGAGPPAHRHAAGGPGAGHAPDPPAELAGRGPARRAARRRAGATSPFRPLADRPARRPRHPRGHLPRAAPWWRRVGESPAVSRRLRRRSGGGHGSERGVGADVSERRRPARGDGNLHRRRPRVIRTGRASRDDKMRRDRGAR